MWDRVIKRNREKFKYSNFHIFKSEINLDLHEIIFKHKEVFRVTSAYLVFFFTLFSTQLSRDPARNIKKKKNNRDLEKKKKKKTTKKSLFPPGIRHFTSAVKPRMGGGASWHGQDRKMHRSTSRSAIAILWWSLTQSYVTKVQKIKLRV
jgi:hypothetical protein